MALLVATTPAAVQGLGDALVLREPPELAEAVVVLAGGPRSRWPVGAALVRAGYAPVLYVLGEELVCPAQGPEPPRGPAPGDDGCRRLAEAWRRGESTALDGVLPRSAIVLL